MTAQEAREKSIKQHTAQKAVSDILECIEKEIESQEDYYDENSGKFFIEIDYNYHLDNVIDDRTEQVIQELSNLGYEVEVFTISNRMSILW